MLFVKKVTNNCGERSTVRIFCCLRMVSIRTHAIPYPSGMLLRCGLTEFTLDLSADRVPRMERIKFVHIIDGSNHNPLLYNSIKFSDRGRFDYEVIGLRGDEGLGEQMASLGVKFRTLGYRSRWDAAAAFGTLFSHFRKTRTEVVQTHLFDASLIGLSAAKLARVPVRIFTGHHSHEVPLHRRPLLTFVDGTSGRFLGTAAIAPSQQMKRIFVEQLHVPERKVRVVHHGFDLVDWRSQGKSETSVRDELALGGKTVWTALGRMFWVKNFKNLVDAFAMLSEKDANSVLLVAGSGDTDELKQYVEQKRLTGKVRILGSRSDVPDLLRASDVFVHGALAESFGMVFIEAMSLGKPVVTTAVGIAPEIIQDGETGFLSEGTDASNLASAMVRMLDAKAEWPSMSSRAVQVSEAFEIRRTQAECDAFYLELLAGD